MSNVIAVSKQACQASYEWQLIQSLNVAERSPSLVRSQTVLSLNADPYLERKLGHYSSRLLLEIAKQASKATFVLNCKGPDPVRFVVRRIEMDFETYVILDAAHPVTLECTISEMTYRGDVAQSGHVAVTFAQGGQVAASIKFVRTLMAVALEERLEKGLRSRLAASK